MGQIDDSTKVQQQSSFERVASMERIAENQESMTIEFLRARLLSERSISKAARQRAQQLAKKVSELEQRVESEIHVRKKLESARLEVLSQHKGELMEEYRHPFTDDFDFMDSLDNGTYELPTQQNRRECCEGESEDSVNASITGDSEGNVGNKSTQDNDSGDQEGDCMDQVAKEKGSLAWASNRTNRQLQIKEWAQSPSHFNRRFSPSLFGTSSPDSESPSKRWIGKSVRQIRARTTVDGDGDREATQDQTKDGLHQSDDEEVDRVLEHQSELIEQFKDEENAQRAWEKKFQEQNGSKDISKDEDSFSDLRDGVLITSDEQDSKEWAESADGVVELAEIVRDASKQHAYGAIGETPGSMHGHNSTDSTTVLSMVIHGGNIVNNTVSEEPPSGRLDNGECRNVTANDDIDMPCEIEFLEIAHSSSEGQTSDFSSKMHADIVHEKPSASPLQESEEGMWNRIDLQRHVYDGCSRMSSGSKFYASSVSSSQGSNSALDSASYQRHTNFSASANNQEGSETMVRSSSDRTFPSRDFIGDNSVQSPSTTSDSYKPFKKDNYEENTRRSTFSSPSNDNSSYGSSKGLMNSSWEEIYKRRIKSQEALKDKNALKNGSPHPFSFMEKKHVYEQSFNTQSFNNSTKPLHTYGHPSVYGAFKERRQDARIHHNSMDAGLERVMEVLRALEIAKHHVQTSDVDAMNEFAYAHQFMSKGNGSYLPSLPVKEIEPFMYDIKDERTATRARYVQSPSRQPISMHNAWIRAEPTPGQYTWSHYRNHPYAGQYST